MLNDIDNQISMYDSLRDKYRRFDESMIDKIPIIFRIYFSIERKEIDMLNKFYYAVMDYMNLGLEPNNYIQGTNDWKIIKPYLDREKEKINVEI